ncbi:MAG: YqgE/AlgH family protein [Chitinophagaceae bacterium]
MFPDKEHKIPHTSELPGAGKILIANPFLRDPNFFRSVVLLCEYREEGSFGFIFNKLFTQTLDELMPDSTMKKLPVYFGGPVQLDTIHFLHNVPDLIEGGVQILPDIYWGGDFERAVELLNIGMINTGQIKLFIGYSGWGKNQLEGELKENSWIVSKGTKGLVFDETDKNIWSQSLRERGSGYASFANYPPDPSLN